MDVTPVLVQGAPVIDSYGPQGFRVAGQSYTGAVILTPAVVVQADIASYSDLTLERLEAIFQAAPKPDVVLLGVGARCEALPPIAWRRAAQGAGIVMEAMSSPAACRTWNVLLSEGRRVTALIFPA
jgi:uncharacterized protein